MKSDNRPILLLSTAAFLCCSVMAGAGLFRPLDVTILGLAQRGNSEVVDRIGLVTSVVGGVEFIAVAAIALAAGLFFQGRRRLATRLLVAFVVTGLIEIVFKMVVPQAPVPGDVLRGPDPSLLDISTPYPYPGRARAARCPPSWGDLPALAERADQARHGRVPRRLSGEQTLPRNPLALRHTGRRPPRHRRTRVGV